MKLTKVEDWHDPNPWYQDGHFFCSAHGDLGEHDKAIEEQTVLYSGEDQLDGYMCMECIGEEARSMAKLKDWLEDCLKEDETYYASAHITIDKPIKLDMDHK